MKECSTVCLCVAALLQAARNLQQFRYYFMLWAKPEKDSGKTSTLETW